ncbi:MAG: ABC transporter permease [Candidatus Rokubacteria bacterium]|nr:ABC transporter permease [Candidatus Rokubacteria bacterium]
MDTLLGWLASPQIVSLAVNMLEQGFLFGFLGLGVLITFRFFRFPDLTAEGSYPLGGAVVAALLVARVDPFVATAVAVLAGAGAGAVTALIHTKLKINNIISGIIVMTAIYSVNLRVMGRANTPLLTTPSVFDEAARGLGAIGLPLRSGALPNIVFVFLVLLLVSLALAAFLRTDLGLAVRATGENEPMIRSLGVNTDHTKILGLAISNGVIALSGALVAQNHGFADIGMGIGVLVTGAAAVLIGEALFGDRTVSWWIVAAIVGVVIYRFLVAVALRVGLQPTDLRFITAALLLLALALPRLRFQVASG